MIEGSIKAERLNKGGKIKSFTSMIKSWQNDPLFRSLHNQPNNIVFSSIQTLVIYGITKQITNPL